VESSSIFLLHDSDSSPVLAGCISKMAEKKEDMGAVTHQLSQYDDDTNKHVNVKEANVASVALSKWSIMRFQQMARVSADST
jgi:hypothetical protein